MTLRRAVWTMQLTPCANAGAPRYRAARSLPVGHLRNSAVVTTNRAFAEWGEVIPNAACVASLVGVYPLREDDSCPFLAVDFDEAEWQADAQGFAQL